MRNNVSSTSLKSLLESYDRDAAANGRKKISTAGSSGVSGMKSSASTLASAIPEKTVVPEISAADAKSLMNAYYKPMLHEAKEAAAAEKKAQAEAKKASKKKSSSISVDDPNADGAADDFWSQGKDNGKGGNSANNRNSKPEKEDDKEKKPGLIARAFGALGSLLSAKNDGENSYLENGYKQDTEKNEKKLKNEDKAEKLRELNRKQAKGREESRAARETNAGLLNKSKLNDSEKAEIYTRVNTWAENPENKSLMTALKTAKTKNRVGDLLEAGYTSQQLDEANEMLELYQKMGKGQVLKERVGGTAKGTVKTVASAGMMGADTAMQTAENAVASVKDEEYRNAAKQYNDALLKTQTMEDSNTAYTLDENGNTVQTEEYQKAWQQLNDARAVMDRKDKEINAPVSKDSSGYKMYQSAQEDLSRSDLGLDAGTKMLKGAATSAAENIAIAAVNPALVLPVLSAQGAAGGMANSIEKEAPAVNTLSNGMAKFMAGWAINSVGVEQMLDTMGANGARNTIAAQIVQSIKNNSKLAQTNPAFYAVLMGAGDNGLQSFAETWADRAIDLATNTAEPMSLQELAAQSLQEAASGALSGAMTAVAGLGVNAGRQAMAQNAQNTQTAQFETAPVADNMKATADNMSPVEQTANEDLLTYGLLDSQYAEPAAAQHPANDNYDLLLDGWNYENSQPLAEERGQLDYGDPVSNIANPNTLDNDEIAWNEQRVNDFLADSGRLSNEEKLAELGNLGIMNDLIHNENELNGVMELLESGASGAYINEYIAQNATDSEKIQFITGKTVRSGVGKALLSLLSNSGSMTNEEFSKAAYDIAEQVEPRSNYHSMNSRYKHQWDDVTWRYAVDTIVSKISQMAGRGDGGYGANTVGAAESKFDRSTAPNLDIAEQTGIQKQLNDAAQNAYGESNQLKHDVYSHKQGEYEAAMNLDLSASEAGGDTNAGINNEVKRLTDVAQWNAEDQYSAKEVRNRISQQLNQAAESGADTTELVARLHAVDDLISMKRSQIGQALEAGKEAALSSENVSQKFSQYKQEQAQKFANKDKNAAKTMEEIASEISDADLSGQQKDFILDFIKERAKAKNVDMTDAQAEKLAQMVQMGAKTDQFYNTILEFASGIDDLSLDQIEQIDNLIYEAEQLPENSRNRVEKERQIYAIMASATKAGFMDKVNAWRYFAMLGNTRTHARNIIGNEAMGLVTGAKDVTATLIEHAVIRDKNDRTKAVLLPTKADNELLRAAYKYANESRYRQLTDNSRFNVKSGIEGEKTVFKNRVAEKARLANNAGLEESDYSGTFGELAVIKEIGGKPGEWAGRIMEKANKAGENGKVGFAGLRAQFARSMAQQMKAKGISADILTSTDPKDIAIVERMADTAVADAQRATFHEDSNTASWLSDKTMPNGVRKFLDAELPFTKTPINIVKQAARYSPMGIVKTATVDAYNLSKGNITINKFVDNLAMGLTGTGIALAGAWLADSGILFVPDKDDKKQSFNEMQGKQGYSIIIDGKSYTIDWLAPAALPLLMGASIAKEAKQEGFGFDNIADSISSLADPMIETTMLSSLSDTLESIRYSESGSDIFSTLLVGGITNYGGQFVPTALGQVARSQDEHRRSNKSFASSKTGKQAEYFMRKQINKIPGLGEALDDLDLYENADYVDAWGRKQENGGLAYNALSPGYLRDVDTTRADQYIDDLYNGVGSEAVLPNVSSSKADVELTPDSYEKYATEKGQTQAALIDELAGQEYISDMPAEVQKKIVSDLYSVAKMAGNKSVDPLWESDSKSDQKLYDIYEDLGENGLVNYVAGSKAFSEIENSDNPAETAELYSGILDELTPAMVDTYMSDDYKKPYQAYKEGGIKAMAAYERASDRYSEINDNGGKYVDAVLSLDDITPAEQGYIYMLHASKDSKVKFLTQHYSKNMAYKLSYWFMRYSAIEDKLKAQIKDTDTKLSDAREAWADQYISNEQERESFIYLYKTARKDWKFE